MSTFERELQAVHERAGWVVAVECPCAGQSPGASDRLHYLFGPFRTEELARHYGEKWCKGVSRTGRLRCYTFPMIQP